jgi:hypothetical protein
MTRRRRRPRLRERLSLSDKFWLFVMAVFLPVLFLVILIGAPRDFRPAWRAHRGEGVPGVFVALNRSCSRSCSWTGDFTSDAGGKVQRDVLLLGGRPRAVGERIPALDSGGGGVVYARSGNSEWVAIPIVTAAAFGYLAVWLAVMIWWLLDRRRHSKESAQAVGTGASRGRRKPHSK